MIQQRRLWEHSEPTTLEPLVSIISFITSIGVSTAHQISDKILYQLSDCQTMLPTLSRQSGTMCGRQFRCDFSLGDCLNFFLLFVALVYGQELRRRVFMKTSIRAEEKDRSINEEEALRCSDEIIKALQAMSKNDIGALIVLSNENVPAQILESGTRLNSDISAELIEGIFIPKAPLHDGAMIVSGTKIVAAGCFLPISEAENIPKDLGTRHRAAIGITEMIDVTVLIVSEETGIISVVSAGKMKRYADTEMLKNTLKRFYWQDMGRI